MQTREIQYIVALRKYDDLDQVSLNDLIDYLDWRIKGDRDDQMIWKDISPIISKLRMRGYLTSELLNRIPILIRFPEFYETIPHNDVVHTINRYLEEEKDDGFTPLRITEPPIRYLLRVYPQSLRNLRELARFNNIRHMIPDQYLNRHQSNIPTLDELTGRSIRRRRNSMNMPVSEAANNINRRGSFTDTECSICREDYENGDRLAKLPCGHKFHSKCVTSWINRTQSCPMCREIVNPSRITYTTFQK
jgi:hypothetical protein